MNERIVVAAVAQRKKNERELWKCSLKCVCAQRRLALSLSYTHNIYDAFWNSIKNECVWHKTSERKCVKRNEKEETKRKWANHTSFFKHLTSWSIVQYSLLRLVCFSLSLSTMISTLILFEIENEYINILYIVASKQVCLTFDDFSLFSPSPNCLFKTMTFFSFSESVCMYVCLIMRRRQASIVEAAIPCLHIHRTSHM